MTHFYKTVLKVGTFLLLFLFLYQTHAGAQQVSKIEYFINTDPGFGKGTPVPVTPGMDVSASFQVPVTGLSTGFHRLYVRSLVQPYQVQEDGKPVTKGGWSLTGYRLFYKDEFEVGGGTLPDVVQGEYYIDADPGFGKAKAIPVTPAKDLTHVSFAFDITSLQEGFHNLYVRFKDANGRWSLSSKRTFFKDNLSTHSTTPVNIVKGEYYFDTDPGFGKGKSIALTPGADLANIAFGADVSSLERGFHRLYIRFQDANGKWSLTSVRTFFKEVALATNPLANVVRAEYFINTDPGFGKGKPIALTPGADITNLTFAVDMTDVTIGNHQLFVRAQDANGAWSLTHVGNFKVEPPTELYVTLGEINAKLCAGAPLPIPFTVNAPFGSNNIFTAQLSNSSGSFANPVNIGTLSGANAGTINATLPANTTAGSNYRIRIVASSPLDTSVISMPITISRVPEQSFSIEGKGNTCLGLETYNNSNVQNGVTYTWNLSGGGDMDTTGGKAKITWTTTGIHTLTLTSSNSCGEGVVKMLKVNVFSEAPTKVPTITTSGKTLQASAAGVADGVTAYQWYKEDVAIAGATSSAYSAKEDGTYTVAYTNPCGIGTRSAPTIVSTKQSQTVTFESVGDKTFGDAPFNIKATASSSLPVTYTLVHGPVTLNGDVVTITGAGTATIRATQAGNSEYNSAFADLVVKVQKATATITLASLQYVYDGMVKMPTATTNPAGLPVTYTYNGSNTAPKNVGSYDVVANISNANYTGTATGILEIAKAEQNISMQAFGDKREGDNPFAVNAAASSRLPVVLSIVTNPATGVASISGNTITIIGAGSVTVTASQEGNENYHAAAQVQQSFTVLPALKLPDLAVQNITADKSSIAPGDVVNVSWQMANVGQAAAVINWIERIYMQPAGGGSRTLLKQTHFNDDGLLDAGKHIVRTEKVNLPTQLNFGNAGVFVVEITPDASVQEVAGGTVNNTNVQQTVWTISKQLLLELSATQITEGAPEMITAKVTRSGSLDEALTVNVSTLTQKRLNFLSTVTIPAGQASNNFTIAALDNNLLEGLIKDTVFVSALNFGSAKAGIKLIDNDKPSLSLSKLPESVMEGESITFQVSTNLAPATPLQVFLTSSNAKRFPVPASVTIPAGALSTNLTVALEQDNLPEIDMNVNLSVGAANHESATGTIEVKDDDVPGLELVLQSDNVAEGAGPFATQATLRRKAGGSDLAFSANLSASLSNNLILPSSITLAKGENEKTFTIGVVDNALAEGDRNVVLTASVFVNSCGCSAPATSSGSVSATLKISDNDGPALKLTVSSLTLPEGSGNAGTLRVTRNTAAAEALVVDLSSSNTSEATIAATATIPAGKTYVDVPIVTINDGITDGNQQVYFYASAKGYSNGSVWVMVSDQNIPDLLLPSVTLTQNSVQAMSVFNYQVVVKNGGFATAPGGVVVRGYLSLDDVIDEKDSLISEDIVTAPIGVGQTAQIINAVQAPNLPGMYKLLFWVNPKAEQTELLLTNNTSAPANFTIKPDYTATANVAATYFAKGTTIAITGAAEKSNGTPAANEKVEVYIITKGLRRTVMATTDATGKYVAQFVPLAKEAGHYTVGASYPGLGATAEQDAFDILGVRVQNGTIPQFKVVVGDTLTGSLSVENLSSRNLSKFTLAPVTLPNGASIEFDTIPVFAGNSSIKLNYKVTGTSLSSGNNFEVATLQAKADEGNVQPVEVFYFCQAPSAHVIADVTKVDVAVSQSKGERLIEITLVNKGQGETGAVNVHLPNAPWISTVTPATMPSMGSGDTALVVLRFTAVPDIPFEAPVNGTIGIATQNGNTLKIPFTYKKVAEATGVLKVSVTNQFTFYSEGAPKVQGAKVLVKNYFTGVVYAQGVTDATGMFSATGVPEGKHRIVVEKDKHLPYDGTIIINPGGATETSVFLNYQAITFNWSVVPTAVEDKYDITLEAKFETHVPMPVVTIDMPKTMPQLSGTEVYAFKVTLTNHGLIAAEDVALTLPKNDPVYEFVTNYEPARLLAQQSIQIPVIMRRRANADGQGLVKGSATVEGVSQFLGMDASQYRTLAGESLNCRDFAQVVYWYSCSISTGLWQKGGALFSFSGRVCGEEGGGGNGGGLDPDVISRYAEAFPSCAICPDPGIWQGDRGWKHPEFVKGVTSCVECINSLVGAAASCVPGPLGAAMSSYSCTLGNVLGKKSGVIDFVPCVPNLIPLPISCAKGIFDMILACGNTQTGFAANSKMLLGVQTNMANPLGPVFLQIADDLKVVMDAYDLRELMGKEYFGDMMSSSGWSDLSPKLEPYTATLTAIPAAVQASILADMQGYEISQDAIKAFFVRWNTSIEAVEKGIIEPNAAYPNIINWKKIQDWSHSIKAAFDLAVSKGFNSLEDMFDETRASLDQILEEQKQAVCATVKVQFSQQLTMTREAFEGTLDIFNGHPTDAMEQLSVNIQITDENGVPSNGLFEIQTKSLENLSDVTGTGEIGAQQNGIVKFIFIPELGAAPTEPKKYNFGGTVRYFDPYAKALVEIPLAAVKLTVNPSPNLMLHYFMQRNILGDDALTKNQVEPSVPAELAVMVENHGYGAAVNMTISSAQPKIIENEKGLAINFNIIGSNFQGQPKKLGVTDINFGTIPALQTRIGQWYFTSSLLGKFVSYEANVVHSSSYGNPDLSLVKGVKIHELTKSIRLYGDLEDGINDFLVNDIFDVADVPDAIYFSQGNRTAKVHKAQSGSFSGAVAPPAYKNTLTVKAAQDGWNYIKLADPGNGRYELVSVTRNDGQVIPLDNAWLTFVTLPVSQPPVYENKFHFVDTFATIEPVTYTIVWKPLSLDVPKVDSIAGAPKEVVTTQVKNLTVVFNKSIDAASFTHEDLSLTLQGGQNIMNTSVVITQIDTATFNIDLSKLTTGSGFYNLNVQAAGIQDVFGISGNSGKSVTWTQYLDVPAVQAFQGIPEGGVAPSFETIQVLFNLPVNPATVTTERFTIEKDDVVLPGTLTIDSVRSDGKLYYLSGIDNLLTQSGVYKLLVDMPNIKSTNGVAGAEVQSVQLTLDNEAPVIVTLEKDNTGGLDAQHITYVNIQFNEPVKGFTTASVQLTRNGQVVPLTIDQLLNVDGKTWKIGNLGMLTYPEGIYTLTINRAGVQDAIGNWGTGTQQITWTVNRSASIVISNLVVSPDLGYSNSDGITSGKTYQIAFDINTKATSIAVAQVDAGAAVVLTTASDVAAGKVKMDVSPATAGNITLKVSATGEDGTEATIERNLFVDEVMLTAQWQPVAQELKKQIDTLAVTFSAKLLSTEALLNAIQFKRNGVALSTKDFKVEKISDTEFEVRGLRTVGNSAGNYQLLLKMDAFSKYTSGLKGKGDVLATWAVLSNNQAPIAKAGNDIVVTDVGMVTLNGTASTDPDGDAITYRWEAPAGVTLSNQNTATPSFNITAADAGKTYSFLLIVSDGNLFTTDVVNVKVELGTTHTYYRDVDNDGWGDVTKPVTGSSAPAGYVAQSGDCNDKNADIHPGKAEICGNGIDDNCNGQIDEGCVVKNVWYRDADGDGWGNSADRIEADKKPAGYVAKGGDCDDNNKNVNPGKKEVCNGIDDDCDGLIDEDVQKTFYRDADGDGYGSNTETVQACSAPQGYVTRSGDCNDTDPKVNPKAKEVCNGIDDDCDGLVDEDLPQNIYYQDNDGDGYGSGISISTCGNAPEGYVSKTGDCNDADASIYPKVETVLPAGWVYNSIFRAGAYNSPAPGCADNIGIITPPIGGPATTYMGTSSAMDLNASVKSLSLRFDLFAFNSKANLACANPEALTCPTWLNVYLVEGSHSGSNRPAEALIYGRSESFLLASSSTNTINVPVTKALVPGKKYRLYMEGKTNSCNTKNLQVYVIDNISIIDVPVNVVNEICGNGIDDNCNGQIDEGCNSIVSLKDSEGLNEARNQKNLLDIKESDVFNITAMPNPSATQFNIEIKSSTDQSITLRVMDALGRVVETKTLSGGRQTISLGQNYRPGIYYLEVGDGTRKQTLKLIKRL